MPAQRDRARTARGRRDGEARAWQTAGAPASEQREERGEHERNEEPRSVLDGESHEEVVRPAGLATLAEEVGGVALARVLDLEPNAVDEAGGDEVGRGDAVQCPGQKAVDPRPTRELLGPGGVVQAIARPEGRGNEDRQGRRQVQGGARRDAARGGREASPWRRRRVSVAARTTRAKTGRARRVVRRVAAPVPTATANAVARPRRGASSQRQNRKADSRVRNAPATSVVARWPWATIDGWKAVSASATSPATGPETTRAQSQTRRARASVKTTTGTRARSITAPAAFSTWTKR